MSNSLKVLNLYCLGRVTVLPSIGKSIFFLFQISGVLGKDLNTFFGNYIRNPCCLEPPNENCMKFASMYRNPRPIAVAMGYLQSKKGNCIQSSCEPLQILIGHLQLQWGPKQCCSV